MSKFFNYLESRHDIHKYETIDLVQYPTEFNSDFFLSQYSNNFTCINVSPRDDSVPNIDGGPRATLISPLHVICTVDNSFNVSDTFSFYDYSNFTEATRTILSKVTVSGNIVVGELDEPIADVNIYPSRLILSSDGDVDGELLGKTLVVVDQDNRVGIREISSVDSKKVHHTQGPESLPVGYLVDDQIVNFEAGDEGCPVFYIATDGRFILIGLLNESGTSVDFISRHSVAINNILDNYGYSLRIANPFEEDTEISPDTPIIKVIKRVYWHVATSSDESMYSPSNDPVNEPGISTLVTYDSHLISSNYLSGSVYAVDRSCLFPRNISIPVFSGNYDISPGYFIFQVDDDKAKKIFQYSSGESPREIKVPEDIIDTSNFCSLHYMLFGAYNASADDCGDSSSPNSYFDHTSGDLSHVVKSYSEDSLRDMIKPYRDVFESGLDAGFYFKMQDLEEIQRMGCCDVLIGTDQCEYHPYPSPGDNKWSRIWMVRQWVNPWFDSRRNSDNFPPLAAELVYAELDPSASTPNWVHAGFISFEDQAPYSYDGSSIPSQFVPDSFNGNLKDSESGFNIDIQDISWDNRGRLWALCSGGFEDSGEVGNSSWISGVDTVEGIYQLIPGGESKRTLSDGTEVPIAFPARLVKRENIRHQYSSPFDTGIPHFWVAKPIGDSYFENNDGDGLDSNTIDTFSTIGSMIVDYDQTDIVSGYEFARVPMLYIDDNNDATIRVMEWHWRPYKDKEPKYSVDREGNTDFNDYDSTTLTDAVVPYDCFYDEDHTGTLRNSRPRSSRGFMDASGIGSVESDEIFNQVANPNGGTSTYLSSFSEVGVRGVYGYEAPLASEFIKYTNSFDSDSGEKLWNKYINDNYMSFNLIDSSPESKRIRLRTTWESRLWRSRETLPREFIEDGIDRDIIFSNNPNSTVDPDTAPNNSSDPTDARMGYSVAIDGDLVIVGEPYGRAKGPCGAYDCRPHGAITMWRVDGNDIDWTAGDVSGRKSNPHPYGNGDNTPNPDARYGASVSITKSCSWSQFGVIAVGSPGLMSNYPIEETVYGGVYLSRLNQDNDLVDDVFISNPQPDGLPLDPEFGSTVDIDGDYLAIGYPKYNTADEGGAGADDGAVFILKYDSGSGGGDSQEKWTSNTCRITTPNESVDPDSFGTKVSISGEYLAVSSISGVYIYKRNDGVNEWTLHESIIAPVPEGDISTTYGNHSLRIHKNFVVDSGSEATLMFGVTSQDGTGGIQLADLEWTFDENNGTDYFIYVPDNALENPNIAILNEPINVSNAFYYQGGYQTSGFHANGVVYVGTPGGSSNSGTLKFSSRDNYRISLDSFWVADGASNLSMVGNIKVKVDGVEIYYISSVTGLEGEYSVADGDFEHVYGTEIEIIANAPDVTNRYIAFDSFNFKVREEIDLGHVSVHDLSNDQWIEKDKINRNNISNGNNNISLSDNIAVIGSHLSRTQDLDDEKPKGKAYIYKRSYNDNWAPYGHISMDGDDTNSFDNFGYSVATNGFDIICGSPGAEGNNASSEDTGLASYSYSSNLETEPSYSYVHDFAGDVSRGKALYSYVGLHGKELPFLNYFEDSDPYIHFYVDDIGNIDYEGNPDSFAEAEIVKSFSLRVREYVGVDDETVLIYSNINDVGVPTSGVYKISDFNVIPFANTTFNSGSDDTYVDRGFFIVLVYYNAELTSPFDGVNRVGEYTTTLARIFHYPNRNNGNGEWDSEDKVADSEDLISFAMSRSVFQANFNDTYSPYRKTGAASGGVFISSSNWGDEDSNSKFINANWTGDMDINDDVNKSSNRLILYPKIGSYRPLGQSAIYDPGADLELHPDLYSSLGLTGYQSEWYEIIKTINMPLYLPSQVKNYVIGEYSGDSWESDSMWCDEHALLPWTSAVDPDLFESQEDKHRMNGIAICARSLSLQIICTDDIGDMDRCRFRLNWSAEGSEADPDDGNYKSAVFSIGNCGSYRMDNPNQSGIPYNYDDVGSETSSLFALFPSRFDGPLPQNDGEYGWILQDHYLPAKEKIFVDSRESNNPFFITGGTMTDRSLLPSFTYKMLGSDYVANMSLGWTYEGNMPIGLDTEVIGDDHEVSTFLYPMSPAQQDGNEGQSISFESNWGILYSLYAVHENDTLRIAFSFLEGNEPGDEVHFAQDPDANEDNQIKNASVCLLESSSYDMNEIMNKNVSDIIGQIDYDDSTYFNDVWIENLGNISESLMGQNLITSDDFSTILVSYARNSKVDITDSGDLGKLQVHPHFIQSFTPSVSFDEYISSSLISVDDMGGLGEELSDLGLGGIRIYPAPEGSYYVIVDINQAQSESLYNSEVLFDLKVDNGDVDEFTECNTFLSEYVEAGYDNAFANANAWVASPMTARNGSQSMVFDPTTWMMYIRSGNAFTRLVSLPYWFDNGTTIASNFNIWQHEGCDILFDPSHISSVSYPVRQYLFHKEPYENIFEESGPCPGECDVFQSISAFSAPSTIGGNNYNMSRFMVHRVSADDTGIYQFDGVHSRITTEGDPNLVDNFGFPSIEHDYNTDLEEFTLSIPYSYSQSGQVQHYILNDYAERRALSNMTDGDTRYDPPSVVVLKTTDTTTGESLYLHGIVSSGDPNVDSYAPYLLIRYPLYDGDTFNQGINNYETNRSFAFCSARNQMQVAYDRIASVESNESLYKYSIGAGNSGDGHGTFMQLDWHDTAGGGFLEDPPGGSSSIDKIYLVQDVMRTPSDLSKKDTNQFGGQICSVNLDGSSGFVPQIEYQCIFNSDFGLFTGVYPKLGENAITVGCHTPGSLTPDFTFPYRSPFFVMDYYRDNNTHYQPMGFFVDNMIESTTPYRSYSEHSLPVFGDPPHIFDPLCDPYDPYYALSRWEYCGCDEDGEIIKMALQEIKFEEDAWNGFVDISVSNDVLVSGLSREGGPMDSGMIKIYRFKNNYWEKEEEILAPGPSNDFGLEVDIDGDNIITTSDHTIHFYKFDGSRWVANGAFDVYPAYSFSVSISGDIAIAGYSSIVHEDEHGRVSSFKNTGGVWSEVERITNPNAERRFGYRVKISGNIVLIPGYLSDSGDSSGSSEVLYTYTVNSEGELTHHPSATLGNGEFHLYAWKQFDISGNTLVTLDTYYNPEINPKFAVYTFFPELGDESWTLQSYVTIPNSGTSPTSLKIDDDVIIFADSREPFDDIKSGTVYVFRFDGINWVYEVRLLSYAQLDLIDFGDKVDIDGDNIIALSNPHGVDDTLADLYLFRDDKKDYGCTIGEIPANSLGACCLGSSCELMTEDECFATGGFYMGDTTSCESVTCPDVDDETCGTPFVFPHVQEIHPCSMGDTAIFGEKIAADVDIIIASCSSPINPEQQKVIVYSFNEISQRWEQSYEIIPPDSDLVIKFGTMALDITFHNETHFEGIIITAIRDSDSTVVLYFYSYEDAEGSWYLSNSIEFGDDYPTEHHRPTHMTVSIGASSFAGIYANVGMSNENDDDDKFQSMYELSSGVWSRIGGVNYKRENVGLDLYTETYDIWSDSFAHGRSVSAYDKFYYGGEYLGIKINYDTFSHDTNTWVNNGSITSPDNPLGDLVLPDGTDVIELLAVQCVTKYIFAMILVRENGAKKIKLYYWGTSNDHIFGVWHEESFNNPDIDLDSGEIKSYSLHAHVSPESGSGNGAGANVIATISVEYPDGSSDNSICFIATNNIGWPAFNKNADAAVVLQYIDGPLSDSAIVRVHPSNSQAKLKERFLVFSDSSNPHIDIDGGVRYGSLHVGYPSYYPPALPVGEAQVSRIDRCKEIITDLFDPNYGQVYCNDFISIASLDFINSDDAPVSFPAIEDGLTTFGNFKIETKDDLIAAVESIDLIQLKNINIGKFFYNLNTFNLDSTFDKRVSPQIPYRSLIFMITSNDESFDVSSDEIDIMNIKDIITGLRSEGILHEQGMIHVADFVPRDRSSLIRIGLTRLAEMSGGYYTPLRGGQ